MSDRTQLVKLNDLARDIPRTIDNAGTASQNTSLVDDVVTREAITLNIAAPFLIAVSERDQAIEALQARVAELEAERNEAKAERKLLQDILDSRPAINAGLPASYVRWSQAVYAGDIASATLRQKEGKA